MTPHVHRLYPRAMLRGAGRVLDLGGTLDALPYARADRRAIAAALARDWVAVGDDLYEALRGLSDRRRDTDAAANPDNALALPEQDQELTGRGSRN